MIVNQNKLFIMYVTMLRTIWAQQRQNLADLRVLSLSLDQFRCGEFKTQLPTLAIVNSFTAYIIYVLYGPQYGKIKQLEVIKFVPGLILKLGFRKCQYFDPKLCMFAVANSLPHLIYVL